MALPLLLVGAAAGVSSLLGIGAAEVAAVAVSTVVVGGVTYYTYNAYTKSEAEKSAAKYNKIVSDCVDRVASKLDDQLAGKVGGHMDARINSAIQANNAALFARFDGVARETSARMDRMDAGLAQILARLPQAPAVASVAPAPAVASVAPAPAAPAPAVAA